MRNFIETGDVIDVTLSAAASAGDVLVIGDLVAIANTDGANGETITADTVGVFAVPKATGASSALTQGATVYWDAAAKQATTDAGTDPANTKLGVVFAAAADADATVKVRIG